MAEFRMFEGRTSDAAPLIIDSLTMLRELRMAYVVVGSLRSAAWLFATVGDWANAARLQAAADGVMET